MIQWRQGDLLSSSCKTLVNPVNCVGVMGAGLAAAFRERYPRMYTDYANRCHRRAVRPGVPYLYARGDDSILLFPTKTDWRLPSQLRYVVDGLNLFVKAYAGWGLESVAFPALGCGCGGLSWTVVRPLMAESLGGVNLVVEIYAPWESRRG